MDCGEAHLHQLPDNIEGVTQVRFGNSNYFEMTHIVPTLALNCLSMHFRITTKICQPMIDDGMDLEPRVCCKKKFCET